MINTLISFILTFIIFFTPLAFGTVHLWSITILQSAILLLFFLYVLSSIRKGVFEYKQTSLNLFFLLFTLYIGLQLLGFTKEPYRTFSALKMSLLYFALFLVVTNTIKTRREIQSLIFKITLAGFFVSLFGIVQFFSGTDKIYWTKEVMHRDIFFGSFINENHFAAYISIIALITLGSIFATIISSEKKRTDQYHSFKKGIVITLDKILNGSTFFSIFAFSIMVTSVFLSGSRGAVVFLSSALLFFIISFLFRKSAKKAAWISLFIFIVILLLLVWVGMEKTLDELSTVFNSENYLERVHVYGDAVNVLRDYPAFGVGVGSFSNIFPMYRSGFGIAFYPHLHNEALQLFVEVGAFGFIVILVPFVLFLLQLFKSAGKTLSSYKYCILTGIIASFLYLGLHTMISFSMRLNAISTLFVILLSMAVLVINLKPSSSGRGLAVDMKVKTLFAVKSPGAKRVAGISTSFIFACLSFFILRPFIAHTLAENADRPSLFERAISLDPKNARLYYDYHTFILMRSNLGLIGKDEGYDKAKSALHKAIRLNPYKTSYLVAEGRLALKRNRYSEASSLLRKASSIEPNNHRVRLLYAYALFLEGLNEKNGKKKEMLLKKGLVNYKMARSLCSYVNLFTTITDRKSFRNLRKALAKEGINVE